jgi:cytochrome c-type biogenesis protein CcmE
MTPDTKRRALLAGAIVIAAGGLGVVAFGNIGENLVYYWSPEELHQRGDAAKGAVVRLGGVVVPGTVSWDSKALSLRFRMSGGHKGEPPLVDVVSTGSPPQMFREGIGVVVEGRLGDDGLFHSDRLMVNHSNEYRAPKEGEKPSLDTLDVEPM